MEKVVEKLRNHWKMMILSVIALVVGGIFYMISHSKQENTMLSVTQLSSSRADSSVSSSSPQQTGQIIVDLKGEVKKPGVYQLENTVRMNELIQMAGGFTQNADQKEVNLAAKLKDEEVVYVAKKGENPVQTTTDSSVSATNSLTNPQAEKVNINTADLTTLQTLQGIGAKKAQDIIDYRTQNGLFKTVDELGQVPGFGDKTLEKLKDKICVD